MILLRTSTVYDLVVQKSFFLPTRLIKPVLKTQHLIFFLAIGMSKICVRENLSDNPGALLEMSDHLQ